MEARSAFRAVQQSEGISSAAARYCDRDSFDTDDLELIKLHANTHYSAGVLASHVPTRWDISITVILFLFSVRGDWRADCPLNPHLSAGVQFRAISAAVQFVSCAMCWKGWTHPFFQTVTLFYNNKFFHDYIGL